MVRLEVYTSKDGALTRFEAHHDDGNYDNDHDATNAAHDALGWQEVVEVRLIKQAEAAG